MIYFKQVSNHVKQVKGGFLVTVLGTVEQKSVLLSYLEQEAKYNTFLISDIQHYGFDKPYQQIYVNLGPDSQFVGVYLKYYGNLILAGETSGLDLPFLVDCISQGVDTIMGKASLVQSVVEALPMKYDFTIKTLLSIDKTDKLQPPSSLIQTAGLNDVDDIYSFLMGIPSLRQSYANKDMLINRIKSGEGTHLFIKQGGKIIAHANSAAQTRKSCMLGGLGVATPYRNKGLGTSLIAALSRKSLAAGRTPCVLTEASADHSLFTRLGCEEIGKWGIAEINR